MNENSKRQPETRPSKPHYGLRRTAAAGALAVTATAFYHPVVGAAESVKDKSVQLFQDARIPDKPSFPGNDEPHREIQVGPTGSDTDTAWEISKLAWPNDDPRDHVGSILAQVPEGQSGLMPGETINLSPDAAIGTEVDPGQR
jgi:hypothetical protein